MGGIRKAKGTCWALDVLKATKRKAKVIEDVLRAKITSNKKRGIAEASIGRLRSSLADVAVSEVEAGTRCGGRTRRSGW